MRPRTKDTTRWCSPKKRSSSRKKSQSLHKISGVEKNGHDLGPFSTNQKIVLYSTEDKAFSEKASRPSPRTSKCVLEDSTSAKYRPFHYKLSSIFHSILSYQNKFRPEVMRNFATLSVPSGLAAREDKQYGRMHLVPYLKHYRNQLYHKNSLRMKISTTYLTDISLTGRTGFNDCKFVITITMECVFELTCK